MLHELLVPFAVGLLVGVNPFVAPSLRLRMDESDAARRRLPLEAGLVTALVATLFVLVSWRFSAFVSGRLTNSLLVLGFVALAGAFYSLRPVLRRGDPDPPATGWRWPLRHAGDTFYYAGPAWLLALAAAMQQLTFARYLLPFLAASAGIVLATYVWTARYGASLPRTPPKAGEPRARATTLMSVAYGLAAVLMLAANLKLV